MKNRAPIPRLTATPGAAVLTVRPGGGRWSLAGWIVLSRAVLGLGLHFTWFAAYVPLILVLRFLVKLDPVVTLCVVCGVYVLCSLRGGVREMRESLRRFHGVEFSPPDAPERFRFVRAAPGGRWRPVSDLRHVRILHLVAAPEDGRPAPVDSVWAVSVRVNGAPWSALCDGRGDPGAAAEALVRLLEPVGVPVEFVAECRPKRPQRRRPAAAVRPPAGAGTAGAVPAGAVPADAVPADAGPADAVPEGRS
ncbi:hypothetical protein ACFVYP_06095 [Kitasatospora sp. NPDC058201]|uniref:hypothetical protein n=1 Tax=unclassified Kitasatospora TaxID=2633591 RepID=UPI00365C1784